MCSPSSIFLFYELSEVMRQQGDNQFVTLLNSVDISNIPDAYVKLLESREVSIENFGNYLQKITVKVNIIA